MKECILSLLWPRQEIYGFFRDHGCTSHELDRIKDYKVENMGRVRMVDAVFVTLSERDEGGLGQFRAMLKALIEWSHFDSYYFDNLRKLDREKAQHNLDHLRQLVEIRDSQIKEKQRRREEAARQVQSTTETRVSLLSRFLDLYSGILAPTQRGYALEKLFQEIAKLEGLEITSSFRCTGEQIDGGLKYDGENYMVEAKWQDRLASTEPLYAFAHKVEGKMYGRGLFISVNGFSPDPVRGLLVGKAIRTILIDGEDLTLALEGHLTFTKMLDEKVRAAQLKGQIYIHPLTNASKVDL